MALAIKLNSKGPMFLFRTRRLQQRRFRMIKFRTMCVDAEARMQEIEHLNEKSGPIFKITNDPRITRVGKWLRKTSIDELPQLINVLAWRHEHCWTKATLGSRCAADGSGVAEAAV